MISMISPQVTKLCDLASDGDSVTSVSWSERVKCKVNFDFYQITLYVVLPIFNLWDFFLFVHSNYQC